MGRKIVPNGYAFTALCRDGKAVSWGKSDYGGAQGTAHAALQSGVSAIAANPSGSSFVAIKDSDNPPPGCSAWAYAIGSYALIFSNISGAIGGQCSAKFQCLCASCLSIFNGEVNSSVPGKYSLVVDSPKLRCKVKKLKELRCNKNAGYERAWDDRKKQDYCRLSLSQVCKATKLMLGGRELQGSLSSPMLAKIGDTTTLEVQLAGLAVQA